MKITRVDKKRRYRLAEIPAGDLFLIKDEMYFKTNVSNGLTCACYSVREGRYKLIQFDVIVKKIKSITYEVEE